MESHDAVFRRTARRYSLCADDADDAYQRALEILLTKAPEIDGDSLVRWMQVVTKREALAVRKQRERLLSGTPAGDESGRDPLDLIATDSPEPTDRVAGKERVARSREALRALKPQEVRALILKAEGYSYAEIGHITGWTYTKINRCMAEGRKRFLQMFSGIEQGERCDELADELSAYSDGELDQDAVDALRVHLEACGHCRAKLRVYRGLPEELLALGGAAGVDPTFAERVQGWMGMRLGPVVERAREAAVGLLNRGGGETATQMTAVGGSRGAGTAMVAKLLAVCGATAAGGAACVATGIVDPAAVGLAGNEEPAPIERPVTDASPPMLGGQPEPPLPEPVPSEPVEPQEPEPPAPPTPAEQTHQQLGFEASAPPPPPPPSGGGSSSGGSNGGGGGPGGGQFGFQR